MATHGDLKRIVKARLQTVNILISARDWEMSFYTMGYVLECALKATICKTLNLDQYPDSKNNKVSAGYFMTHKFDQLITPSGMEDTFSTRGPTQSYKHWSDFTKEYPGEWPAMRYDVTRLNSIDELKVKALYNNLEGIIAVLDSTNRW